MTGFQVTEPVPETHTFNDYRVLIEALSVEMRNSDNPNRDAHLLSKEIKKLALTEMKHENKPYLKSSLLADAYSLILDGKSVKEALETAAIKHKISMSDLASAKHNAHYIKIYGEVISKFKGHEVQKSLIDEECFNMYILKNPGTPNKFLRRLNEQVKILNKITGLRDQLTIKNSHSSRKEKVSALKNKGLKAWEIASTLGIKLDAVNYDLRIK